MDSVSPVLTDREVPSEQVIALGQEQYYPIIVARIIFPDGSLGSVVRFSLSDAERKAVFDGADILLTQPHHGSMMPIFIQLALPGEYPK